MNRVDFMTQLERLLQNISPEERAEALQYYEDYFDDAGAENEQDVIEALGNPAKVAENIRRDLYGAGYGGPTYQQTVRNTSVVEYTGNTGKESGGAKFETWQIVLIVLACVVLSPVIIGAVSSLGGILISLILGWFGAIVGFGIAAIALMLVAIALIVVSFPCFAAQPFAGVAVLGISLLVGAFGILLLMLTVAMAGIATPAIFRGIGFLFGKIKGLFTKNKAANA